MKNYEQNPKKQKEIAKHIRKKMFSTKTIISFLNFRKNLMKKYNFLPFGKKSRFSEKMYRFIRKNKGEKIWDI